MRHALIAVTLLALSSVTTCVVHGEDGFRLPTLRNPFRSAEADEASRVNASVSDATDDQGSGFALPKIPVPKLQMPKFEMPHWRLPKMERPSWSRAQPATGPSTWEKLSQGTKSMFTKTRDTLMPWAAPEPPPVRRNVTGARARVASSDSRREADDKPFYSSLIPGRGNEEESPRLETTNDFLSLPRPQFD